MKSIIRIFFISLFISGLSVESEAQLSTQQGGHCYTMDIPDYMVKTFDLNEVASLQYTNTSREAYVICIEDPKDQLTFYGMAFSGTRDFLEDFLKDYKKDAPDRKVSEIKDFSSNSNSHSQVVVEWTTEGTGLSMLITVVETDTHFYKIMCWTLTEYKEDLFPDYYKIASSLKD